MANFKKEYLEMLLRQVTEEINYLHKQGHSNDDVKGDPCVFCFKDGRGEYICNRMQALRQFESQFTMTCTNKNMSLKNQSKIMGITIQCPYFILFFDTSLKAQYLRLGNSFV